MTERIGQQFGNYRLVRLLGQGGFADVYLAEHVHLETLAAVKVLSMRLTSEHVEKFRMEARTIARLIHPHIVRVLDYGVEQDTPYLVMDYAPHGSLHRHHPRGKRLPIPTVVEYVKQVAEALQYAHEKKVIYRDIKPENLLMGEQHNILLSDFGIAMEALSSFNPSTQEMIGTMAYMAPEQIRGKPRRASDQYALGVVVYEWLTGDRPFHGSLTEIVGQHLAVLPPSLREKVPTISPAIEQVVLTALEKDPQNRFASVRAFAVAFEQASQSLPSFTLALTPSQPFLPSYPIPLPGSSTPPEPAQPPVKRAMPPDAIVPLDQPPLLAQGVYLAESSLRPDLGTTSNLPIPQQHTSTSLERSVLSPYAPEPATLPENVLPVQARLRPFRRHRRPLKRLGNFTLRLLMATLILLLVLVLCWRWFIYAPSSGSTLPTKATTVPIAPAPPLHIAGNQLVDSQGEVVRLTGANRSGTESRCLDYSVFDGPNSQASIDAMLRWHINAICIPLNEDCWLNINLRVNRFGGNYYREHIEAYVDLLISNGITPILDLHWSAPGKQRAVGQEPLPDRGHSIAFWQQVAAAYKGNNAVIFDLFNEPFPDTNKDTLTAWDCWKYGTNPLTCPSGTAGLNYEAAGMDELVTVVRNTGATNVIMLGGIQYASTLDHWMDFKPDDPLNKLAASWHLLSYNQCNLSSCWGSQSLPLMAHYPVITGEIGEDDWGGDFIAHVMNFLDNPGAGLQPQSYLAWVWNTDQTKYDLIMDYSGTPTTPYGKTYMDHLLIIHLIFLPVQPDRPENRSVSSQLVGDRRVAPSHSQ